MVARIAVLFGSQTGSAADVAERVHREVRQRDLHATLNAMDDYEIS